MKKNILIYILLAGFFNLSKLSAQDKRTSIYGVEMRTNSLEVGAEYLKPSGDFSNVYNNGFGASLRYRFALSEHKSLLASVGYNTFKGEVDLHGTNPIVGLHANFIPVKVGLRFRFFKYVYAAGEIGTVIKLGISGIEDVNEYARDEYRIKGLLFDFAPTLGVQIPTTGKNYLDIGFRYEGMTNSQQQIFFTGIRASYAFNIKR